MRVTMTLALVLDALQHGASYGFDIIDRTGLQAGTVYPILRRLEEARHVKSRWESVMYAREEGRPSRRLYTLTPAGHAQAAQACARYPAMFTAEARRMRAQGAS
jgi:PadR family transcriptional regulator PadR